MVAVAVAIARGDDRAPAIEDRARPVADPALVRDPVAVVQVVAVVKGRFRVKQEHLPNLLVLVAVLEDLDLDLA